MGFTKKAHIFRITRKPLAVISSALTVVLTLVLATTASAGEPITQHVSDGSPDAWIAFGFEHPGAGCDANFSLMANLYADGSMSANTPIDSQTEMAFTSGEDQP